LFQKGAPMTRSKETLLIGFLILLVVIGWRYGNAEVGSPLPEAPAEDVPAGRDEIAGVHGDGVADDTEALQRAIEKAGGDFRFPKGTYRLTKSLVLDLDKLGYASLRGNGVAKLVMDGPGPAIKVIGTHFKSADPGGFEQRVWDRQRMPLLDGLAITGRHHDACGVEAVGTMQLTLTRIHLRKLLHGIHLRENNRNVIIADCHIYENQGVGVYYDNVNLHQSNITNCHISYCDGGGVVSRQGNVRNIHIAGCDLESNMSPEAPATANVLIDCSNSAYGTAEVAITGCTIQHNNPSPDSANIRILGGSLPSGSNKNVQEGNVAITGNVLSDVQVNVHLRDCRGVTISGNTFWQGYRHNLLIEQCSSVVMGANNFDRNPRYSYGNTSQANNGGAHVTNVWRDPAGLLIENCRRMNITGCTILNCDNVGLLLRNVVESRVSDCLIRDDREDSTSVPLLVVGGRGNQIIDNLINGRPQDSE
jgi:hypothetical protein